MSLGLASWACVPIISTRSVAPQPLTKASVGKGCTAFWIRCDSHVATQGGFDSGFDTIPRLVIMTTFRFLRFISAVTSSFLKTPPDCLHFVPLFLKLFASTSLSFFFLVVRPTIVQGCFWWFLISRLGWSLSSCFCDRYISSSSSSFRVRRLVRFLGLRG